jgi:hypothetical protein
VSREDHWKQSQPTFPGLSDVSERVDSDRADDQTAENVHLG